MVKDRAQIVWVVLLVLGICAVYFPGLHNELVFDDQFLVSDEFEQRYGGLFELRQRLVSYGSFMWLEAVAGHGWWKQRLVNVLLHLGVVMALYSLFRLLSERIEWPEEISAGEEDEASRLAALRVGVTLFALNPVAVYAVAYLIQRSILGATLFVVLAFLSFSKGLLTGRIAWHAGALFCYVLAMLCKEHALMAPLLAVPLYVFLLRPTRRRIAMIVGASIVLIAVGAGVLLKFYDGIVGAAFDDLSKRLVEQLKNIDPRVEDRLWPLSILNQATLFFRYGLLWFVPNIQWMSVDLRPPFPVSMMAWQHLAGALAYVGLLAGAAWMVVRRSDPLGFAGLCLLFPSILFVTEFATVWIQDPFVLYRSYLWAISIPGLVLLLLTGLKPSTIYTAGLVIGLVFAGLALERVLSFKHLLSVWSDAAEKVNLDAPPNAVGRWRPFLNRGSYYLEHELLDLAYRDLTTAIELGEPQGSAQFNLGVTFQLMERPAHALEAFTVAESMGFEQSGLYYHRAEIHYALGHFVEAVSDYTEALARPQESSVREHTLMRRAEAAIPGRRFETAIEDFKLLLQRRPDDERLLMGLGMAYLGKQEPAMAEPLFERLIEDRPNATAHYGRALARHMLGKREGSLHDLDVAISLDPDNELYQALRNQIAQQP